MFLRGILISLAGTDSMITSPFRICYIFCFSVLKKDNQSYANNNKPKAIIRKTLHKFYFIIYGIVFSFYINSQLIFNYWINILLV